MDPVLLADGLGGRGDGPPDGRVANGVEDSIVIERQVPHDVPQAVGGLQGELDLDGGDGAPAAAEHAVGDVGDGRAPLLVEDPLTHPLAALAPALDGEPDLAYGVVVGDEAERRRPRPPAGPDELVSPEVAATLRGLLLLDTESERVVFRARATGDGIVLWLTADDLDGPLGFVAAEANHEEDRRRQKRLDAAFAVLDDALAEAPPY